MAYDLEEQEQLANLKAAWKQYGNMATWVLIIGLGGYAGWNFWSSQQLKTSAQASVLFEGLNKAVVSKDNAQVMRIADDLKQKFPGSHYTEMASLLAAKSANDAGDLKRAKEILQAITVDTKNEEVKAIAKIRLSGLLLDEKLTDQAMTVLGGDFPAEFAADQADRKGDVFVAQGKIDEARKAYQLALEKSKEKAAAKTLIQIKLDAIGGVSEKN